MLSAQALDNDAAQASQAIPSTTVIVTSMLVGGQSSLLRDQFKKKYAGRSGTPVATSYAPEFRWWAGLARQVSLIERMMQTVRGRDNFWPATLAASTVIGGGPKKGCSMRKTAIAADYRAVLVLITAYKDTFDQTHSEILQRRKGHYVE